MNNVTNSTNKNANIHHWECPKIIWGETWAATSIATLNATNIDIYISLKDIFYE